MSSKQALLGTIPVFVADFVHELGDFVGGDGFLSSLVLLTKFPLVYRLEEVVRPVHPDSFLVFHFLDTNL